MLIFSAGTNTTKPFDHTLYKEVLCQWRNGNYRVMVSTYSDLASLKGSTTAELDMYDAASAVSCTINWTAKTATISMGNNGGKVELYAR